MNSFINFYKYNNLKSVAFCLTQFVANFYSVDFQYFRVSKIQERADNQYHNKHMTY